MVGKIGKYKDWTGFVSREQRKLVVISRGGEKKGGSIALKQAMEKKLAMSAWK